MKLFGKEIVFMDAESIGNGFDWEDRVNVEFAGQRFVLFERARNSDGIYEYGITRICHTIEAHAKNNTDASWQRPALALHLLCEFDYYHAANSFLHREDANTLQIANYVDGIEVL